MECGYFGLISTNWLSLIAIFKLYEYEMVHRKQVPQYTVHSIQVPQYAA